MVGIVAAASALLLVALLEDGFGFGTVLVIV
jgi:hypothetical protein